MSNNQPSKDKDPFDVDFDQSLFDELDELSRVNQTSNTNDDFADLTADDITFDESSQHKLPPSDDLSDIELSNAEDLAFIEALGASDTNATASSQATDESNLQPSLNASSLPTIEEMVESPSKIELNSLESSSPNLTDESTPPVAAAAPKKSLFGKKPKTITKAAKPPKAGSHDPKKLNWMILAAMVALLLLVAAWFLTRSEPAPSVTPSPAAPVSSEPVVQAESSPSETSETSDGVAEGAQDFALDIQELNPDEILKADVPSDPALIKEEIDRLADQDQRLAEQVKDIETYLSDLQKLNDAKEEKITLLEAQIAQLEAEQNK